MKYTPPDRPPWLPLAGDGPRRRPRPARSRLLGLAARSVSPSRATTSPGSTGPPAGSRLVGRGGRRAAESPRRFRRPAQGYGHFRLERRAEGGPSVDRLGAARVHWELDIDRSWQRNPTFYLFQTLGTIHDRLLQPPPLAKERSRAIVERMAAIPRTLEQGAGQPRGPRRRPVHPPGHPGPRRRSPGPEDRGASSRRSWPRTTPRHSARTSESGRGPGRLPRLAGAAAATLLLRHRDRPRAIRILPQERRPDSLHSRAALADGPAGMGPGGRVRDLSAGATRATPPLPLFADQAAQIARRRRTSRRSEPSSSPGGCSPCPRG